MSEGAASRQARRRWLVDGSNVVGSRPDGWWRDRPAAFDRLAAELDGYAHASGDEVTVVVDGPARSWCEAHVEVVYAPSADDRIVELAAADADPSSLLAVTSDRALGQRVRRLGAPVTGAGAFLQLLRAGAAAP